MENMKIYEAVRKVPDSAKKNISAGRLKGMTDINPMWRIKALTEQFGPCGIGWKVEVSRTWQDQGADGVVTVYVQLLLYVKFNDAWSAPIPGIGGSSLVAKESKGLYTSDECYKMAYTDALSVCCKMLGFGADVYWAADRTKYQQVQPQDAKKEHARQQAAEKISPDQVAVLKDNAQNERVKKALAYYKVSRIEDLTRHQADQIFMKLGLLDENRIQKS